MRKNTHTQHYTQNSHITAFVGLLYEYFSLGYSTVYTYVAQIYVYICGMLCVLYVCGVYISCVFMCLIHCTQNKLVRTNALHCSVMSVTYWWRRAEVQAGRRARQTSAMFARASERAFAPPRRRATQSIGGRGACA